MTTAAAAPPAPLTRAAQLVFSGLFPHAPIVVPDVGGERLADCAATSSACRELARRVVAHRPDRLVLVSPHAPRLARAFGIHERVRGDLGEFGAPGAAVDLPPDPALRDLLERCGAEVGLATWRVALPRLDHGATVPLWFLAQAGWDGPTTVLSLPQRPERSALASFGRAVGRALALLADRPAVIASGDLTHRATPGAPAGYHPRAAELDRAVAHAVASGHLESIPGIAAALRDLAAEDVVDSSTVVAAATSFRAHGAEVLSYEHPFGVGYLVAVFHDGEGR